MVDSEILIPLTTASGTLQPSLNAQIEERLQSPPLMVLPVPKPKEENAKDSKRSPPGEYTAKRSTLQPPPPIPGFRLYMLNCSYTWSK